MGFVRTYREGDYEITQYTSGGNVRNVFNGEIIASYTNFWMPGEAVHPKTQQQLNRIKDRFKIEIQNI